jgi:Tfp pilus assembly protein PilO
MINTRTIILTVVFSILIGLGIYFGIIPEMNNINTRVENLKEKNATLQDTIAKYNTLTEMSKSKDQFDSAKILALNALPDTLEKDKLTLMLEKVTSDDNVTLSALEVGSASTVATAPAKSSPSNQAPTNTNNYKTVSGTISGEATFDKIKIWLTSLENLERLVTIKSLTITNSGSTTNTIKAEITYTAYGITENP